MYSSIKKNPTYERVGEDDVVKFLAHRLVRGEKVRKLIITRNPFDRIESFFRDKFRKNLFYDKRWQKCQKVFFDKVGVSEKRDSKDIISAFRKVGFNDFVSWLPEKYRKDEHLHPQSWRLWVNLNTRYANVPIKILGVERVPIENMDKSKMKEKWKIDISIQENKTKQCSDSENEGGRIEWSRKSKLTVKSIYKKDFLNFGYNL